MSALEKLLEIMRRLRDPKTGCPWDIEQTFESIAPHTLEEVYEVVDAIENGSKDDIKDELGDLLFQVIFYAQLGKEAGDFDFDAIAEGISDKLLRRHPHVFPDGRLSSKETSQTISSDQVVTNWEEIKKEERKSKALKRNSALDDVPAALPALTRAAKLQKRAASAGFDWVNTEQVISKLQEEVDELKHALESNNPESIKDELGDVLFSAVNMGRHLKLDPETVLRQGNTKFESRYRFMENLAITKGEQLKNMDVLSQEALWKESKKAGK